jgi:flagellar biosynthesis/type III secretory pathway protein FliH
MSEEDYDNGYADGYTDGQNAMETTMEEKIDELKSNIVNLLKIVRYAIDDVESEL